MSAMQDYVQQNIYVQNFIRAKNYDFTPEYSELIGRLCAVENAVTMRPSARGLCSDLMAVLKGFVFHGEIDRICLSMRIGQSNELLALDTCNSDRILALNLMEPGYRCFVRPQSSLLSLREGEIRAYDEALRIAEAFEKRQKPIQRSIAYIIKMGFRSGVCVPLHIAGELRGFLFLNSLEEGLFSELEDEDYAIINILGMIAKLALAQEVGVPSEYVALVSEDFPLIGSRLFDEDEFTHQLQCLERWQSGGMWRPNTKVDGDMRFLYSPTNLAYVTWKVCSALYRVASDFPNEISIVNSNDEFIQVQIPLTDARVIGTLEKYRAQIKHLESALGFLRYTLVPGINHVAIQFPFDPISKQREDVLYSVTENP